MRKLPNKCAICEIDMTEYLPEEHAAKCPKCGDGYRMYEGNWAAIESLLDIPIGRIERKAELKPGYGALAAQIRRRMDRVEQLYAGSNSIDAYEVLDEIDALIVAIYHMSDWMRKDPQVSDRVSDDDVWDLYSSYPLALTRSYANTYKHLVLDPPKGKRALPYVVYARIESYQRVNDSRPVVLIKHWAEPAHEGYHDGSVEALKFANECLDALQDFGTAKGI